MKDLRCSLLVALLLLSACGTEKPAPPPEPSAKPAAAPAAPPAGTPKPRGDAQPPVAEGATPPGPVDMDGAIQTLLAKPEVPDESIVIQHVLIGFKGAPRLVGVTRTKEEAKVLAETVYAEAVRGGDFDALVKQYTNDSAPGIYPLTKAGRNGMVKGFGDVGFRLKAGEIGVSPWDASASPFGWHIIKRLK